MAVIPISLPALFGSGQLDEPETVSLPFTGTILEGDILNVNGSGQYVEVASNGAAIAALAAQNALAIYESASPSIVTPFGTTQAGTALQPGWDAGLVKGVLLHNSQQLEINVFGIGGTGNVNTAAQVGTQVGLALVSGVYVGDPSKGNKVFIIQQFLGGPNKGVVGTDQQCRAIVTAIPSALTI